MKNLAFVVLLTTGNVVLADLTVFTDRPQARFNKAAEIFQNKTGQKVSFVEAPFGEIKKKLASGEPADAVITKDLIYLADLKFANLLQSLGQQKSLARVAPFMRDGNNQWVALTYRVRTLVYNPQNVKPEEVSTYSDLAKPEWQGRLCLRSGKAAYNEALVAHMISVEGEDATRTVLKGWMDNLAQPEFKDDIAVLQAIATGLCDVGIVNHYYFAQTLAKTPNFPAKIAFLNQSTTGVHSNGMGLAMVKSSQQNSLVQQLVEILLTDEIQLEISAAHMDYPAVVGLQPNTLIKNWGTFKLSDMPWDQVAEKVSIARQIIQEVGYE